jgi:hypothetical protein
MAKKLNLKGAVFTGTNLNRFGYVRHWKAAVATGVNKNSQHGGQLVEVTVRGVNRMINVSSFTGMIQQSGQSIYFESGKVVRDPTDAIRAALGDIVLGKGHNLKVAESKYTPKTVRVSHPATTVA